MRVSIITPTFNSKNTIKRCLSSIFAQNYPSDLLEVIVVDCSTDSTPDVIRSAFPKVRMIRIEKRIDISQARNIGIANATGEVIIFLDSDCAAEKGWLRRIVSLHKSYQKVDCIGGSVTNGNDQSLIAWADFFLTGFSGFLPTRPSRRRIRTLPTCNVSVKRRIFEKFRFPSVKWGEDVLLGWKLYSNGYDISIDPKVKVAHFNTTSYERFLTRMKRGGEVIVDTRTIEPALPGSFLIKHPHLFSVFPFAYTAMIAIRVLKEGKRFRRWVILTLPLLLIGSSYMAKAAVVHMVKHHVLNDYSNIQRLDGSRA